MRGISPGTRSHTCRNSRPSLCYCLTWPHYRCPLFHQVLPAALQVSFSRQLVTSCMAFHNDGPVNTKTAMPAVHTHDGHTKLYPPLFMPSFPNHCGLHLMPTASIAVHSDTCLHARLFPTPDKQTHPPLPFFRLCSPFASCLIEVRI